MTMPSITIRVDFGDAGSGAQGVGISQQGAAPAPMSFAMGDASISTHGAMSNSGAPTPFANAAAAAMGGQDMAPTPMSGMGAMGGGSTMGSAPPEPSADMASAAHAGGQDTPPHPEGEPAGAAKKPTSKA